MFDKFKVVLKSSKFDLFEILNSISDGGEKVTHIQFRNAIKRIGISMSSKDIDKLILRLDSAM